MEKTHTPPPPMAATHLDQLRSTTGGGWVSLMLKLVHCSRLLGVCWWKTCQGSNRGARKGPQPSYASHGVQIGCCLRCGGRLQSLAVGAKSHTARWANASLVLQVSFSITWGRAWSFPRSRWLSSSSSWRCLTVPRLFLSPFCCHSQSCSVINSGRVFGSTVNYGIVFCFFPAVWSCALSHCILSWRTCRLVWSTDSGSFSASLLAAWAEVQVLSFSLTMSERQFWCPRHIDTVPDAVKSEQDHHRLFEQFWTSVTRPRRS